MAIYKRDIASINLETGTIHRTFLNHSIGYKDQKADHFGIRVFRDGEPVDLTGVSVQGIFMPPQGDPIAITSGNIVDGNVAEVVLPQACYNYDGQFCLSIKLVDSNNSVTGTMRIVDGMVDNTHASGTVAPTSAVPTYQEILSTYDAMVAATAAANGAIAPLYANLTFPVKAGQYAIVDGALKRSIVDIATSEAYTAAHWTAAKLGPDLSDLKSAFDSMTYAYYKDVKWVKGGITVSNGTYYTDSKRIRTAIVPITANDIFMIKIASGYSLSAFAYSGDTYEGAYNPNAVNHLSKADATVIRGNFVISNLPSGYDYRFMAKKDDNTDIPLSDSSKFVFIIPTDKTLTLENASADAKVTGDKVNGLIENVGSKKMPFTWYSSMKINNDGTYTQNYMYHSTHRIICNPSSIFAYSGDAKDSQDDPVNIAVAEYDGSGTFIKLTSRNGNDLYTPVMFTDDTYGFAVSIYSTTKNLTSAWKDLFDYAIYSEKIKEKTPFTEISWGVGAVGADGSLIYSDQYSGAIAKIYAPVGTRLLFDMTSYATAILIYDNNKRKRYYGKLFEYVTKTEETPVMITSLSPVDFRSNIKVYQIEREKTDYDVIIAAYDSSEEDKKIANYICDGSNDEVELNCAVNSNISCGHGCKVLLCRGTYKVEEFVDYHDYNVADGTTDYTGSKGAIITRTSWLNDSEKYAGEFYGYGEANVLRESTAKILVSSTVMSELEDNVYYQLFSAVRKGTRKNGYIYGAIRSVYIGLWVQLEAHDKNIVCFDGTANATFIVNNCQVRTDISSNLNFENITMPERLIGICGDTGENDGTAHQIKYCVISGFNVAVDVAGENFVVEKVTMVRSFIGLKIHGTDVYGGVGHQSVYINLAINWCDRVIYIDDPNNAEGYVSPGNYGSAILIYGCSTEEEWTVDGVTCNMKPIFEKVKGNRTGYINMEWPVNKIMYDINAYGASCANIKLDKAYMPRILSANVGSRSLYSPTVQQPGTQVWDMYNKCMLFATDQGWIKADGTIVDS